MRKLTILAVSAAALTSTPAFAVSTFPDWDGASFIEPFGCPDTSTYGQVVKVPNGKTTLNAFSFVWQNNSGQGPMTVRGEIYAWDGTKATGSAVYESEPRSISYHNGHFHKVTFAAMAPVTPGAKYVVFATTDKDHGQCPGGGYQLNWGLVDDTAYPNGSFVYQNNGGDSSQWTTSSWEVWPGDLTFKATFGP